VGILNGDFKWGILNGDFEWGYCMDILNGYYKLEF